ncbi:MAG: regulatory signaling modulator protein AmpE [Porticoccaceae bacterium]|nr:regulatory signaling modulator protein AmpE [Porticoccaceae bacterium]
MIFLSIILALTIVYYRAPLNVLQSDSWFFAWVQRVSGWGSVVKTPSVQLLLTLGLPVVGISLLLDMLEGVSVLLLLVVELWVLVYSFGRGDLQAELNTLQNDLQRGDSQAAFHVGEALNADKRRIIAFDLQTFSQVLRQRITYAYFERYLAVIFWSLIGGAAGALLYRLSVLYRSSFVTLVAGTEAGESGFVGYLQLRGASRWLTLLEWLPLGLVSLTLGLVGSFGAGLSQWLTRWFSLRPSADVLQDCVADALGADKTVSGWSVALMSTADIATNCIQLIQLFRRVLLLWLCLLALALIL